MYATENLSLQPSEKKVKILRSLHYSLHYAVTKTKTIKATINGFTIQLGA